MNELVMNKLFMEQHEHVPEAVPLVLLMNELVIKNLFPEQHEHAPEVVLIIELFMVQYHILEGGTIVRSQVHFLEMMM